MALVAKTKAKVHTKDKLGQQITEGIKQMWLFPTKHTLKTQCIPYFPISLFSTFPIFHLRNKKKTF